MSLREGLNALLLLDMDAQRAAPFLWLSISIIIVIAGDPSLLLLVLILGSLAHALSIIIQLSDGQLIHRQLQCTQLMPTQMFACTCADATLTPQYHSH